MIFGNRNFAYVTSLLVSIQFSFSLSSMSLAHDGPDPIGHWMFNQRTVVNNRLAARLGPDGTFLNDVQFKNDPLGQSVLFSGDGSGVILAENFREGNAKQSLPVGPFTVSAWFSVKTRQQWGSVISIVQDNGDAEKGWVLGYNRRNFYFALATTGVDDGNGKMTYLTGETAYQVGRLYHVVGVFDGRQMQLYVNGKLDATSNQQSGSVLYPDRAPYTIGVYRDENENHPHHGRIRDIALYNLAAKPKWVAKEFKQNEKLASLTGSSEKLSLAVPPYLQMVTQTSIVVSWQASIPTQGAVYFGETAKTTTRVEGSAQKIIHHVKLENLDPNTQYFYRVESIDESGQKVASEVLTFQTAGDRSTPYAFAVISDTQGNPRVAGGIAKMAWEQRPNFVIHPGDLVSTGTNDTHWTEHFFPSMHPLIGRVAMFPVLGNHELNAQNYYDYMMLPDPEYFYAFQYGNAQFFMIDSNKKVAPGSEQYQWLDEKLGASTARWKFVVHHHPPYSSDENDYGDLWKTNKSTRGDARIRQLTALYDKHQVDIAFNGHIHSYERTWPVYEGKVVSENEGTVYMITGGGGGDLETPGPYRPFFQNNVRRGHHYTMVYVNGGKLELKSFNLEGRLFDYMQIDK